MPGLEILPLASSYRPDALVPLHWRTLRASSQRLAKVGLPTSTPTPRILVLHRTGRYLGQASQFACSASVESPACFVESNLDTVAVIVQPGSSDCSVCVSEMKWPEAKPEPEPKSDAKTGQANITLEKKARGTESVRPTDH